MALKADRHELQTDISFFYDAGAVTRGGVVCHGTAGSGSAMDQGVNLVEYVTTITNAKVPVGILLNDVVNKDLTRTHLNHFKDEVQKGGKVTVLRKGWVVTSNISGSPAAGEVAFVGDAGVIHRRIAELLQDCSPRRVLGHQLSTPFWSPENIRFFYV